MKSEDVFVINETDSLGRGPRQVSLKNIGSGATVKERSNL